MAPPPPNLANAYPWMFVDTQGNEFHFEVDPVTGQEHYQDHNNLPVDPPPQGWVDTVQAHYQFLAAQQVPPPAAPTPPNQQQGVPPAQGPPGPAGPPGPGQPNPPGAPPQQPQQPQPQQQQPLPQQVPNPGVPPAAATPPQQPPNPQPTGGQPQTGPPPYQSPQPSAPFSQSGASNVTGTTTAGASAMAGMLSNMNVDDLMRLITGDKGTAPFFAQWLQTNAPSLGYTNVGPAAGPSTSTGGQGPSTQGTSAPTAGPSTNAPAAGSAPFQPQGQTPFYRMGASTYVPPSGGGAASSMFGGVSQGGPSAPSVPGLSAFRTHPSGMPGPQEGGGFQGAPLSVASAHSTAQHSSVSHSSSGIEGLPAQFTKSLRCSYFKGETDEDVILWASDLEEHLRALKVPVEMWAVAMGLFLKAGAGRWARSLPNTIRRDYCFFREALLAQYAGPMVFKARALLHGAKMDIRKETVMDFANKLQMLTAQSYPDTLPSGQQQMVLSALIQGVPLEIKRYGSAALACHTLREALGHLIAGERFYHMDREAQREKKANAPQVQSMIIEDVTDDHQALSLLEGRLAQTAQAANPGGPPTIPPQVATYLKGLLDVEHRDANTALNAIQQQQQGKLEGALRQYTGRPATQAITYDQEIPGPPYWPSR